MPKVKILVVDDEEDVRDRLSSMIQRKFYCDVDKAANGTEALEKLRKDKFDLVVLDIKMPGLSGIDVIKEASKFTPDTKILAVSAYDSHEVADEALRQGAIDFIHKPQTTEGIELRIRDILTGMGKYEPKQS